MIGVVLCFFKRIYHKNAQTYSTTPKLWTCFFCAARDKQVRHAAYNVMRCTAWQPGGWGLPALFSQPGFREFLENRDSNGSKVDALFKTTPYYVVSISWIRVCGLVEGVKKIPYLYPSSLSYIDETLSSLKRSS